MTFRVGQKVVCIEGCTDTRVQNRPRAGEIFTVVAITQGITRKGLVLLECPSGSNPLGWWAQRFRPIVERKTDISIFTKMLTPKKERV